MSEARAPNYELAKKDYMNSMKYKDIAEKYNVTINTVKSWKTRYKWTKDSKKGMHTKEKKVCTQKGAQPGNKNAVGHGAPIQNKNAETHGFFSKYFPEETFSIIQEIQQKDPLDILWENIQIAYAAIVRAQNIMYVKDINDKTTTKIEERSGETSYGEKWEIQQAWDKQANFLKAQARAQSELRSLIKQYDELLHKNWELATEEQIARIAIMKAKANDNDSGATEDDGFIEALQGKVDDIWSEE